MVENEGLRTTEGGQAIAGTALVDGVDRSESFDSGIPSGLQLPILPDLVHIESEKIHVYKPELTVENQSTIAEQTPEDERTSEQRQILQDAKYLQRYCFEGDFKAILTPDELHELAEKFRILERKQRPDFNGVEGRIIDFLNGEIREAQYSGRDDSEIDSLKSIVKRANNDGPDRKGMTWGKLEDTAAIASKRLEDRIKNKHGFEQYQVHIMDPRGNEKPNLRKVFQFVADDYMLEVIGKRLDSVTTTRQEAFVGNANIINEWFSQTRELIDQIPSELRIRDGRTTIGARYQIINLIDTMNERLNSTDTEGPKKDYMVDPAGAISLQKKIGYTIETINRALNPESDSQEDIEPLE